LIPLYLHRHLREPVNMREEQGPFGFTRSNRHPLRTQAGAAVLEKRT